MNSSIVKLGLLSAVLLLALLESSCVCETFDEMEARQAKLQQVELELAEPLLKFSSKILRASIKAENNIVLSPVSIHCALSSVLLGADDKSSTQAELIKLLGYQNDSAQVHQSWAKFIDLIKMVTNYRKKVEKGKEKYTFNKGAEIQMINMAVVKKFEIKSDYEIQLRQMYESTVEKIENAADVTRISDKINKWGKDAGFKSDLSTPDQFDGERFLMLVNAIRLKAFWVDEFGQESRSDFFHNFGRIAQLAKNSTVLQEYNVKRCGYIEFTTKPINPNYREFVEEIKNAHSASYKRLSNFEFRAIKIPMSSDVSFTIIEPLSNGTGNELAELEKQILGVGEESDNLIEILKIIDSNEAKTSIGHLKMPGYDFESEMNLKEVLKSIGLRRVFEDSAEFSKIGRPDVRVTEAKHKAMIEVNKQGIKAAGATQILMVPLSRDIPRFKINVEIRNPNIFVIRFGKLPLFVGHLVHL